MYYSASIFATLGYRNGTAVGLLIAIFNFLFTLLALRVGTIPSLAYEFPADMIDRRLVRKEKDDALYSARHGYRAGYDSCLFSS
jgi:hypothetical protein